MKRRYEETFQKYLLYRALADLRRSWRIVLPNLEQCGLLQIDYLDLREIAAEGGFWADVPILGNMTPANRQELLSTILDFFRLEFALHSENFLTPTRLKENEKHFREQLRPPWTLDRNEGLNEPYVIRLDPLHRTAKLYSKMHGPGQFSREVHQAHSQA